MSIISQKSWEKLIPEEEKDKIRRVYSEAKSNGTRNPLEYEFLFGKENLQPKPKPKIKTWKDLEKENEVIRNIYKELEFHIHKDLPYKEHDLIRCKMLATYQIQQLIELGYGGIITDEEWEERINEGSGFYTIVYSPLYKSFHTKVESCNKQFIAFHTSQQADEFMSYPENVKLLRQYNLL